MQKYENPKTIIYVIINLLNNDYICLSFKRSTISKIGSKIMIY